jgi:hypothetical protein
LVNSSFSLLKRTNIFIFTPFFSTVVLALVALVFTKYYFLFTSEYYPPAYADKVAKFEADKVFQKRFLVPVTANFISHNTTLSFDHSLKFIITISTLGLLFYFKKTLEIFTKNHASHYWCLLLLIPVGWNYMFINSIFHSYDIPSLFFYCLGLHLFLNKKYFLFYIIFAVATFNRESTCFISISIALLLSKFSSKYRLKDNFVRNFSLIRHLLAQAALWFLIVLIISWLVKDSPGRSYELTYSMREFIANMWNGAPSWPFLNTETFLGNPRCFLTLFGCTWVLIPFLWKYIPGDCKKLLLLIPIYMIPAILFANLMETRVYHELNVVITLAFISGLIQFNAHRNLVLLNKSC